MQNLVFLSCRCKPGPLEQVPPHLGYFGIIRAGSEGFGRGDAQSRVSKLSKAAEIEKCLLSGVECYSSTKTTGPTADGDLHL